jgi:hypothetical protein
MLVVLAPLFSGANADSNSTESLTEPVVGTDFGTFDRNRALVFCFLEFAISVVAISVIIWWMLDTKTEETVRDEQLDAAADGKSDPSPEGDAQGTALPRSTGPTSG